VLASPSLQEIERFLPLLVVGRIVGQGSAFYQGLARLLGATVAGYTQAGASAPLTAAPTICAQG
jgi:hypothetical protein